MKIYALFTLFCLASCQSKTSSNLNLTVNHSTHTVEVSGLSITTLHGIKNDSLSTESFQTLFPVYKMPADTDMRNYQNPQKGKYTVTDSRITFTPDTPFAAGQTYFARWYRFDKDITAADMITNKRRPGQTPYTELVFKY